MKALIVAQIWNNEVTVATVHCLLLLRAGGLGNSDFQKRDQEKRSSPLELKEGCNCEAKEDIKRLIPVSFCLDLKREFHICRCLLIFYAHTWMGQRTNGATNSTQTQHTNTKQSRWALFCVELKAFAKPVPLSRGGVHKRRFGLPEWLV